MRKIIYEPTRVHTRKLDRSVARARMKLSNVRQINKSDVRQMVDAFGCRYIEKDPSFFAENWRKFANVME